MSPAASGLARSVQTRLARHARAIGVDPNLLLVRFAAERFLSRLSRSRHAESFVLKGALLLLVWLGETIRPTRDADLLGFGDLTSGTLASIVSEICRVKVEPDGLLFDPASIIVNDIRPEDAYGGKRVTLIAHLGPARIRLQVDVGIGDAVVPAPRWIEYPALLDFPRARVRAYRPETVIAEKVHTMVVLGMVNSRMRDFFDVLALAERMSFEGDPLVRAFRSTFKRRRTPVPAALPVALTRSFAQDPAKRAQWAGFVRKNRLSGVPENLGRVVENLADFLGPVLLSAAGTDKFKARWAPGGPWK